MKSIEDQQRRHSEPFWMVRQATGGTVERGMVGEKTSRMSHIEFGLNIASWQKQKEVTTVLRGLGVVVAITGKDQGVPVMAAVPRAWQETDGAQMCNLLPRVQDGFPICRASPSQSTPQEIGTVPNEIRRYSAIQQVGNLRCGSEHWTHFQ